MIIFCEKQYAEERLEKGFRKFISFRDLSILARYFKYLGLDKGKIRKELISFCKKFSPEYNEVLFDKIISNAVSSSDKYNLRIFSPIGITKKELEVIRIVEDYRYQKILFVMLIISKMLSQDGSQFYVNIPFTEILKHAKVSVNKDERLSMSFALNMTGLIETTTNGTYRIDFVDPDQSNPSIIINDYKNIVEYLPFICSSCGKEIRMISKSRKMCKECFEIKRKEDIKNNVRNLRSKV